MYGVIPKYSASNSSIPLSMAARRTYAGLASVVALTPAAVSISSDRVVTDSSPARRLSQNFVTESAPGNRPAMPITAIAVGGNPLTVFGESLAMVNSRVPSVCPTANGPGRGAGLAHRDWIELSQGLLQL